MAGAIMSVISQDLVFFFIPDCIFKFGDLHLSFWPLLLCLTVDCQDLRGREGERSKWVQEQTPSNIAQQNSSACDLVNMVSSPLSISPSKAPSEAFVLHRGPLTLDLCQPHGPFLCADTVLWSLLQDSFTAPEEWKKQFFFSLETKWKMNNWLLFYHSFHLVSPCWGGGDNKNVIQVQHNERIINCIWGKYKAIKTKLLTFLWKSSI